MRRLFMTLAALLLLTGGVLAQTSTGNITGTVTDNTGGVIPGAEVTAERTATGESRTAITGDNGIYRFLNVTPGKWTLSVELTGFKRAVSTDLPVTIGEIVRADFVLEVGELSDEIIVSGQAELVNKEEGRLSNLVQSEEIEDLPLNGRNAYQLAQLGPGIHPTMGVTSQDGSSNAGESFITNGQRHRANNFLLDGTDNNYVGIAGTPTITPQVDIIEEFRVHTNQFSAEFGRNAGAIINVLTKSGSNEFHGTVYEYHRNDALDAREFFDSADTAPLIQHTFGFTVGGPILKNKLFFFGGYEGFRETAGESSEFDVESQQMIDWLRQNNPNSIALQLFERFPLVNGTPSDPNFDPNNIEPVEVNLATPTRSVTDQWNLRIDLTMSDNDRLYGRFTRQVADFPPELIRPGRDSVGNVVEQAFTFSETHIFSPSVVNEFRAGWNEREPNFSVQDGTFDVPTIGITGFSPDFGANSNIPQFFARHTYQGSNQLSWSRGSHTLKFGAEFRHGRENSDFQSNTRGAFTFDDITDFLVDNPESQTVTINPATGLPTGTPRHFRVNEWAMYVQDDWKVTPQFTLNIGLRYENFRPPYEADGIQSNLVLGQGDSIFERLGNGSIEVFPEGSDIYQPDNNNFAPRLGFAWDPTGDGRWAIRGGYGISYNRIFMNITSNIKFNPPFTQVVEADQNNNLPILYSIPVQLDPELVSGGGSSRFAPNILDPDLATSYVQSIFFGVQREVFGDWLLEANYVSTLGRKLYAQEHFNRFTGDLLDGVDDGFNPNFNIASDDFLVADINQSYHAGQFSVNKRFGGGLGFRVNYTWAKNIDDDTDVFGTTSEDSGARVIENRKLDRSLSSIHVGNRFAANWVWEMPFGRNADNWFVRNVLGGWQLNGLVAIQDGTPASVVADSSSFGGRGDFNGDGATNDSPNDPGFNASDLSPSDARFGDIFAPFANGSTDGRNAFTAPAPGTNGTLGRNTFFFPGFKSFDFSLFKTFRMKWFGNEDARWQFRWEVFNVFNNVNVMPWQENLASSAFGESTSTQDAREMQFALKFIF